MQDETYQYIYNLTCNVATDHFSMKTALTALYVIGSFLFGGLSSQAVLGLIVLITMDFCVAIWDERKHGQEVTAKKSKRTPIKILVYFSMIAGGHMVEYGLPVQAQLLDDSILAFLLVTELISVMKHFGNLGYKTPNKIINSLQEKIGDK